VICNKFPFSGCFFSETWWFPPRNVLSALFPGPLLLVRYADPGAGNPFPPSFLRFVFVDINPRFPGPLLSVTLVLFSAFSCLYFQRSLPLFCVSKCFVRLQPLTPVLFFQKPGPSNCEFFWEAYFIVSSICSTPSHSFRGTASPCLDNLVSFLARFQPVLQTPYVSLP